VKKPKFDRFGIGIAKGMALTLRHLLRRPITVQYPEERLTPSRRFRGNGLVWYVERCNGCRACARICPVSIIDIETSRGDKGLVVEKLEIDFGRCMFCGLCVEACPVGALFMSTEYEKASYRRELLVMNKEEFIAAEKRPSAYGYPDLEAEMPPETLLIFLGEEGKLAFLPSRLRTLPLLLIPDALLWRINPNLFVKAKRLKEEKVISRKKKGEG
jgi:NAD(P)H-quinone oxidoreductase subunit I